MYYPAERRDTQLLPHDPLKALIAPRPVGWVSTISASGQVNLAPYSFFNAFSTRPMILGFSSEGAKDSATFARETGEFVWNMASFDLRLAMNATSAPLPRGISEFDHAGLTAAPSMRVRPPRVGESPASLECKVTDIIDLKSISGERVNCFLVLGEVVGVHIQDQFIQNGRVMTAAMQPLARCGYMDYAVANATFELERPPGG
ncbi:MAG: flavin reductase family protein [Hyphomicrobiales bacterium]|nr:flavin reductase family protein [Hyphomicrobiales bacterium]